MTISTGNLSISLNKKIIDELKGKLTYINYYFQGEPYINKNFFEFINYANSKKIFCSTSTNGHFLNDENCIKTIESGLKRLIISIDGNSQETYEVYRKKGKYKRVIDGTKNILKCDYVISIDNSIAHLSGFLNVKTFLMLPLVSEWRWFQNRSDTPWYNSVKIFRQVKKFDWGSVINELVTEINNENGTIKN